MNTGKLKLSKLRKQKKKDSIKMSKTSVIKMFNKVKLYKAI